MACLKGLPEESGFSQNVEKFGHNGQHNAGRKLNTTY